MSHSAMSTAAIADIVDRFHRVADQCDAVLIVGSDYTDVASPSELSVNARIAVNLGAPVVLAVRADASGERVTLPVEIVATVPARYGDEPVARFTLGLSLNPSTFGEGAGAGASTATLSVNPVQAADFVVSLASSDTTELTVPVSATIPANTTSVIMISEVFFASASALALGAGSLGWREAVGALMILGGALLATIQRD